MASFSEILILLLLPILQGGGDLDLLTLVDPQAALEALEQKVDEAGVLRLIAGEGAAQAAAAAGGGAGADLKELEKSIQNLASGVESVREKARARLLDAGAVIKARLEEVVAKDPRRAEEARKLLAELAKRKVSTVQEEVVVRILAIHWASEKKLAKASPGLESAARAENRFVASAARAALDSISGKAVAATAAPARTALPPAVEALPKATRILLEILPRAGPGGGPSVLRIDRLMRDTMSRLGMVGMPPELVEQAGRSTRRSSPAS